MTTETAELIVYSCIAVAIVIVVYSIWKFRD